MQFVSLQQARDHLRSDTDADDNDVTLKIMAATSAVMNYIGEGYPGPIDTAGVPIEDTAGVAIDCPFAIKAATLLMLGNFYADRDGNASATAWRTDNYLSPPVMALLYPYRTPTVA
jgi:hypothetical protein